MKGRDWKMAAAGDVDDDADRADLQAAVGFGLEAAVLAVLEEGDGADLDQEAPEPDVLEDDAGDTEPAGADADFLY